MWVLFIAAIVAVAGTLTLQVLLILKARKRKSRSEILGWDMIPPAMCTLALAAPGGGSGIWLACVLTGSGVRLVVGIVGGVLLALSLILIVPVMMGLVAWLKDAVS